MKKNTDSPRPDGKPMGNRQNDKNDTQMMTMSELAPGNSLNSDGFECLSVGQPHPLGPQPDGARLSLGSSGFSLLASTARPTPKEFEVFRQRPSCGLYTSSALPHGLLLWKFGTELVYETPFDPTLQPDDVRRFVGRDQNAMVRFLLDEGIVRQIALTGLPLTLIHRLQHLWGRTDLDWQPYNALLKRIWERCSPPRLWMAAEKFAYPDETNPPENIH